MSIEIKSICKSFGENKIFDHFSAEIPDGKITGICGPSGIGKTTLLRMLAGLEKPDSGEIKGLPEEGVSYVFQDNRLLPWMTVRENIAFVLNTEEESDQIDEVLRLVSMSEAANQSASTLSGGQMKRVAFARAFCKKRRLLLMDEPFTGLDAELKQQIMRDFMCLWQHEKPGRTVVLVSHELEEIELLCSHRIHIRYEK